MSNISRYTYYVNGKRLTRTKEMPNGKIQLQARIDDDWLILVTRDEDDDNVILDSWEKITEEEAFLEMV